MVFPERKENKKGGAARLFFRGLCVLVFFCGLFFLNYGYQVLAEQPQDEKKAVEGSEEVELPFLAKDDGFVYKSTERSDPFMPFGQEFIEKEGGEAEEILTGMRRFEPRQLTLVAIVSKDDESVAMVEGPEGKGYLVNKGTRIGRAGVVEDIMLNRVIIKEKTYARTGEQRYNVLELLLKKGEDLDK